MATMTSAQLAYLLDEITSSVMVNEFTQNPQMMGMLYNMIPSTSRRERSSSFGGFGQFDEKVETQAAVEETVVQQFQKTFNHTPFAKTAKISREVVDDEDWGFFSDLGSMLAEAATRTMETQGAGVFNDAATGATYVGEDALSLGNNAHLNVDSGNSQDNLLTAALSFTNLATARKTHKAYTDYKGEKIFSNPSLLLVPDNLESTAWELVNSRNKPGGAQEDNFFNRVGMSLAVWNFLTDDNDWFLIDPMLMRRNLRWYMRTGLEVYGDGDLFTGTRHIGAYFRKSHGFVDWRWVTVSQVA